MKLPELRAAIVTAVVAQLPTVQVKGANPAEDRELRESVWIEQVDARYEWRSIGAQPAFATKNRTEEATVDLRVDVYREAPSQLTAAEAAADRCEALLAAVEDAVEADLTLGSKVSFARVSQVSMRLEPRESGWAAIGSARIEATNHP